MQTKTKCWHTKDEQQLKTFYAKDNSITNYYAMTTTTATTNAPADIFLSSMMKNLIRLKFMTNEICSHHERLCADRPEPLLCQPEIPKMAINHPDEAIELI